MKCKLPKSNYVSRSRKGSSMLEVPVALWLTFIVMLMPMLALASISLRATLLNIAVQDAIQSAAKAKTFEQSSDAGLSAKDLAQQVFQNRISAFPGLDSQASISVGILITSVFNSSFRTNEKLIRAADSAKEVYQIEGIASANIDPIFAQSPEIFGRIPGLTSPLTISIAARQTAENPEGLDR